MIKKLLIFALTAILTFSLFGCSKANDHGLSFAKDNSGRRIIHTDEMERQIIVEGGIMTIEIDDETKLLETALTDGEITIAEILETAREDVKDGDIEVTEYPDGSLEYHYETFNLVVLNTYKGDREICFIPTDLNYYSMIN